MVRNPRHVQPGNGRKELSGQYRDRELRTHALRRTDLRRQKTQGLGTADPQPAVHPDVGRPAAGDKSDHHPADPLHHGPRKQIADGDSGAADAGLHGRRRHAERARRNRRAAGRGSGKGRSGTRHGGHVRRNRRPLHPPQGTQQGRRGDPQRRNRPDGLYSAEIHRKDRLTIRSNIHT